MSFHADTFPPTHTFPSLISWILTYSQALRSIALQTPTMGVDSRNWSNFLIRLRDCTTVHHSRAHGTSTSYRYCMFIAQFCSRAPRTWGQGHLVGSGEDNLLPSLDTDESSHRILWDSSYDKKEIYAPVKCSGPRSSQMMSGQPASIQKGIHLTSWSSARIHTWSLTYWLALREKAS